MAGICLAEDGAFSLTTRHNHASSPRLFFVSLLVSVLVHLAVVVWYIPTSAVTVQLRQPQKISLRISLTSVNKFSELVEPVLLPAPSRGQQSTVEPKPTPQPTPAPAQISVEDDAPRPSEDLQTVIQRASIIPDSYRLTQEDLPSSSATSSGDAIFDPRLRQRLRAAASPRAAAISASVEVRSIHGDTSVMINDERCMSSDGRRDSVTRASDWYLTHCMNVKTEGEMIMDRVNRSLRAKR